MDVVIDVILTEAVVAHAAGAIPELQLRVVCVRAAADGALVVIGLVRLLALNAPRLKLTVFCRWRTCDGRKKSNSQSPQ